MFITGIPSICIISFCYIRIYILSVKQRKRIPTGIRKVQKVIPKHTKGLPTTLILTCAYFVCWLPFVIYPFLTLNGKTGFLSSAVVQFAVYYMVFVNSFVNWLIYCATQASFRKEQKKLFKTACPVFKWAI